MAVITVKLEYVWIFHFYGLFSFLHLGHGWSQPNRRIGTKHVQWSHQPDVGQHDCEPIEDISLEHLEVVER